MIETDFTTLTQAQPEQAYTDSPTEGELKDMIAIGAILKAFKHAEDTYKTAKVTFSQLFTKSMALQVVAFRDAYWEQDKNGNPYGHVSINGTEMSWNDFIEALFGVSRQWLNTKLRQHLAPAGDNDDDESSKKELLTYVKGLDEDGASALIAQINDNFNTDDTDEESEESDEEAVDEVERPTAPADEELMSEKEKVLMYAKRISRGRAELLKLFFEEIAAKLGLDDRIVITVE